jgi:thiamine-monophosphate kinase
MSGTGEFDLIAALAARLERNADVLGIGDDAAAWAPTPGALIVATTDMLVEGVHFRLDWTTPRDLGWKALAVNLSDLAAMGAAPGRALVSVALRPEQTELVAELYEGLSEVARLTGTTVVGGDTVRSSGPLVVNVALLGEAEPNQLLRRDGARPGDLVALTGVVGVSAAGLALLLADDGDPGRLDDPRAAQLLSAHFRPSPRLAAGRTLAALGVRCAIDISDGVASEVRHIAEASGVAVELDMDRLPLDAAAVALFGDSAAREFALSGGEDYQLMFTVPEEGFGEIAAALGPADAPQVIGRVTGVAAGGTVALLTAGRPADRMPAGYEAF